MKKINEMTDRELKEALATLNKIDLGEITDLSAKICTELERRKNEAERKEKERIRQEEERLERLAKSAEEERQKLVASQIKVLGKYFKEEKDGHTKYYKVIGVNGRRAIVDEVTETVGEYRTSNTIDENTYVLISTLLACKEIGYDVYNKVLNKTEDKLRSMETKKTHLSPFDFSALTKCFEDYIFWGI